MLAYALRSLAWMHESAWVPLVASVVSIALLASLSLLGLRIGKRVHSAGGAIRLATYAILLVLPLISLLISHPLRPEAARIARPDTSLFGLNVLAKMGFGAFSGFEYVAIFAGESKNPVKGLTRSIAIAAPIVLFMFVAGTTAIVAYRAPDDIDLIAPIPQVLSIALGGNAPARALASAVNLAGCVMLFAAHRVRLGVRHDRRLRRARDLPIVRVESAWIFSAKIATVVVVPHACAIALFSWTKRRRH